MGKKGKSQKTDDLSYHDRIEMAGAGIKDVSEHDPNSGESDVRDVGGKLQENFFDDVKKPPAPARQRQAPRRAPPPPQRPPARPAPAPQARPAQRPAQAPMRPAPAPVAARPAARPAADPGKAPESREAILKRYQLLKQKYEAGEIPKERFLALKAKYTQALGQASGTSRAEQISSVKKKMQILDDRFLNDEITMEVYDKKKAELESELRRIQGQ